jgi:hypothetical protein
MSLMSERDAVLVCFSREAWARPLVANFNAMLLEDVHAAP